MKTISALREELNSRLNETSHDKMRSWLGDKIENSDMDIDQMRAEFLKKFGRRQKDLFDDLVGELMAESTEQGDETVDEGSKPVMQGSSEHIAELKKKLEQEVKKNGEGSVYASQIRQAIEAMSSK